MSRILVSGSGLFTPPESISNQELVTSFNAYVSGYNRRPAPATGMIAFISVGRL